MCARLWCEKKENLPYYLISVLIAVIFATNWGLLNDNVLRLLLWPHAAATGAFYNVEMHYIAQQGYVAYGLPMRIGSQCSGIGFMCLMFAMLSCMFVHRFSKSRKWIWLAISALVSIVGGTVLTSLRIVGSIPLLGNDRFGMFHAGVGICIYTLGLIIIYNAADRLTQRGLIT